MHSEIESLVEETRLFRYKEDDIIPEPDSCAVCGEQKRNHGWMYSKRLGYHQWIMPDNNLRLKRMKSRRKIKNS